VLSILHGSFFFERPKKRAAKITTGATSLRSGRRPGGPRSGGRFRSDAPTCTSSLCSRRGMNRKGPKGHPVDSPARRAQTTIHSNRVLASPPDAPDRARPGGTTCESMNAAPSPESRAGTGLQVYQRTQHPNLTSLPLSPSPPFPTAGPREAERNHELIHGWRPIERICSIDRQAYLRTQTPNPKPQTSHPFPLT
jgi:hypothetical protein